MVIVRFVDHHGPFRVHSATEIFGIIKGSSKNAARDRVDVSASAIALSEWASDQAKLLPEILDCSEHLSDGAAIVRAYGGDVANLPIAYGTQGWMNRGQIADAVKELAEIVVHPSNRDDLSNFHFYARRDHIQVLPGTFVVRYEDLRPNWSEQFRVHEKKANHFSWGWYMTSLVGEFMEVVARTWGIGLQELLDGSDFSTEDNILSAKYAVLADPPGDAHGEDVEASPVHILRRP